MKSRIPKTCALAFLLLLALNGNVSSADSKRDQAWEILQVNLKEKNVGKRAQGVRVLGLLPGDPRALKLAEQAATDEKPDVRAAAAAALGQLHAKSSGAILHKLPGYNAPSR